MPARKILVLGTGGTIAGRATEAGDNVGYTAGQVPVATLVAGALGADADHGLEIVTEQVAQLDSKDMSYAVWRALALRCREALADPAVHGIVITHGTDTIEETAWFLALVLAATKPIVLTCAMRPATAQSPDGPQNLLDAVSVALQPGWGGVVVVAAGEVHGAQQVRKVHPYRVNAFDSGEEGALGWMEERRVRWARQAPTAASAPKAQAELPPEMPWVEIVHSGALCDGRTVDALVQAGVQGIVVAATGNGTVHAALLPALERAAARGIPVWVASRCPLGALVGWRHSWMRAASGLSPAKARVSLALECLGA